MRRIAVPSKAQRLVLLRGAWQKVYGDDSLWHCPGVDRGQAVSQAVAALERRKAITFRTTGEGLDLARVTHNTKAGDDELRRLVEQGSYEGIARP